MPNVMELAGYSSAVSGIPKYNQMYTSQSRALGQIPPFTEEEYVGQLSEQYPGMVDAQNAMNMQNQSIALQNKLMKQDAMAGRVQLGINTAELAFKPGIYERVTKPLAGKVAGMFAQPKPNYTSGIGLPKLKQIPYNQNYFNFPRGISNTVVENIGDNKVYTSAIGRSMFDKSSNLSSVKPPVPTSTTSNIPKPGFIKGYGLPALGAFSTGSLIGSTNVGRYASKKIGGGRREWSTALGGLGGLGTVALASGPIGWGLGALGFAAGALGGLFGSKRKSRTARTISTIGSSAGLSSYLIPMYSSSQRKSIGGY